jgi:asparagine synthase (glutamine-hydrolysing)
MCGICGVVRIDGGEIDPARVTRMRDVMAARGPDGAGLSQGPGFVLGHRRLAIIDLSEAGHQPMTNEDGSIQIVLNGEIYNFADLRPELEAAGHCFRSRTDTEILIHGYEAWGLEGLLKRVRGMYAFVLHDARRGETHMARDPLGKKPLFFGYADGELVFASSARALVLGLRSSPEVDPRAIHDLLWDWCIPGPRSIFVGVEKLLPGHALTLRQDGSRHDLIYWQPDFCHPEQGIDEEEWLERIDTALDTAVKRRLVADVPVGVMLSGGVDSSLVVASAARAVGSVRTFSVAAEDPALDESQFARAVAEQYGTLHHSLPVRSDVRRDLPRLVTAMGEPMGDAAAANLFTISQMARECVTVVLTGDGGDECFGGYPWMWCYWHAGRLRRCLPSLARPPLAALGEAMMQGPGLIRRAGTLLHTAGSPLEHTFFFEGGQMLDEPSRASLFTEEFQARLNGHDPMSHYLEALPKANGALPVDRIMQDHLQTYLPDVYLAKVDLATMAASLEARCPFLDLDLVELATRVPAARRFSGNRPKGLLRRLARRYVPPECVDRRKRGFSLPFGRWLRHDWSDLVDDLVLGSHVERRGWFRREALERVVAEHRERGNRAKLVWMLLVLELWIRMNVEG